MDVSRDEALLRRIYHRPPPLLVGGKIPPPVLQDRPGYWQGMRDSELLHRIQTARIRRITINRGGSSVSLRLHMEGGASAAFKPNQVYKQSIPRKEIAAYVVNRVLGFSRVPPATYRVLPMSELLRKVECGPWRKARLRKEILPDKRGNVAGEVSWWIPEISHVPLENWNFRKRWHQWLKAYKPLPLKHYRLAAQISVLLVFDFLINNLDRFSGWNICGTPNWSKLFFMDNTMSFYPKVRGSVTSRTGLERVQRFSKKLFYNLQRLSESRLRAELTAYMDAPWPVLSDREIRAILARRLYALRYIHRLVAKFGWERTMVFP